VCLGFGCVFFRFVFFFFFLETSSLFYFGNTFLHLGQNAKLGLTGVLQQVAGLLR